MSDVSLYVGSLSTIPTRDHDLLTGLTDDDHAQYALLAGRSTPQTFAFGTAASAATGYLTSTAHATKGKYFLNAASTIAVDELNVRLGIGIAVPTTTLELKQATSAFVKATEAAIGFDGRFGVDATGVQIGAWTNSNLSFLTNATKRWDIQYDGDLILLTSTAKIDLSAITAGNTAVLMAGSALLSSSKLTLAGGGQIALAVAASADTGYLTSTAHATKGKYFLNAAGTITIDELNTRIGIGTATPGEALEIGSGKNIKLQDNQAIVWGASPGGTDFQTGDGGGHSLSWYTNSALALSLNSTGILSLNKATGYFDLSAITAGSPNLKITATSDTPTVAFTGGGNAPTTAPSGYLEILVGASARYIPFWA